MGSTIFWLYLSQRVPYTHAYDNEEGDSHMGDLSELGHAFFLK